MDFCSVDKELVKNDEECIYLCGQSLGLMPVQTIEYMDAFLNDWATL
jgi:kynureninase